MANKLRCSMEVISFPALLPMIPGLYAYETILSIVKYSQASTIIAKQEILINIFEQWLQKVLHLMSIILYVS